MYNLVLINLPSINLKIKQTSLHSMGPLPQLRSGKSALFLDEPINYYWAMGAETLP